jgi:hypothetical protein
MLNPVLWHAPILVSIGVYYSMYLRHISALDGLMGSRLEVVLNTSSFLLGGPQLTACDVNLGLVALAVSVLAVAIVILSIVRLAMRRDDRVIFYSVSIFLAPTVMVILTNPTSFSVRYLLPAFVAAIPLISGFLAHQRTNTKFGGIFVSLVLAAVAFGNFQYLRQLLTNGRAEYRQALEYIIANSDHLPTTLSSANDFRTEMIIDYYKNRLSKPGAIVYQPKSSSANASLWYLGQGYDRYCPAKAQATEGLASYSFEKLFDFSTLSGWQWFLYKKVSS